MPITQRDTGSSLAIVRLDGKQGKELPPHGVYRMEAEHFGRLSQIEARHRGSGTHNGCFPDIIAEVQGMTFTRG